MKRKAAQSKQNSTEHTAGSSSGLQNANQGIVCEEATGKTVDFIRYVDPLKGAPAFEIRFADGTFLFIEPVPRNEFRVRFLKAHKGNARTVREL
jgi:hypothetical protein